MRFFKQIGRVLVIGAAFIATLIFLSPLSPAEAKPHKAHKHHKSRNHHNAHKAHKAHKHHKAHKPGKKLAGLYNTRYCEIFSVTMPEPPNFFVDIFNTVGLNRCPPRRWNAIDLDEVKESQDALVVARNGPRRWVIDGISGAKAGKPFLLSGLRMRHVASLATPTLQPAPFTQLKVNRTTTWNYRKGRYLRQVISPNGRRYAMQAYSRSGDPRLKERQLNRINHNPAMALPKGWRFKVKKLKRKVTLRSAGSTRIVRDGLGCVYQTFRWKTDK